MLPAAASFIRRIIALKKVLADQRYGVSYPLWLQNPSWHRQVTHVDRLPVFLGISKPFPDGLEVMRRVEVIELLLPEPKEISRRVLPCSWCHLAELSAQIQLPDRMNRSVVRIVR